MATSDLLMFMSAQRLRELLCLLLSGRVGGLWVWGLLSKQICHQFCHPKNGLAGAPMAVVFILVRLEHLLLLLRSSKGQWQTSGLVNDPFPCFPWICSTGMFPFLNWKRALHLSRAVKRPGRMYNWWLPGMPQLQMEASAAECRTRLLQCCQTRTSRSHEGMSGTRTQGLCL